MGSAATRMRQSQMHHSPIAPGIAPWREAEQHIGITADDLHNYAVQEEAKEQIEDALVGLSASYRFGEDYEDVLLGILNHILHPSHPKLAWVVDSV